MNKRSVLRAAEHIDWLQVSLNNRQIYPSEGAEGACFALEDNGSFCLRGKGWPGHRDTKGNVYHPYVSLHELLLMAMI